ncbi:MAG: sigma-70 family RNA polymerase sigma factor [Oscillospiraceae bacterium]|nr:sigma-70 family RNA polymerase sigma factor [Oscillospiraceae bacterium]
MAYRVSERTLQFDQGFIAELMQIPVTNRNRLAVVCRALQEAIDTELTPRQREVLMLSYYAQKNGIEIAKELGISPSAVCRTRLRAEQRLRRALRFYMEYLNCPLGED